MIKLIVGRKGTGKTKILIDMLNKAAKDSAGNVVCIDKGTKLTYDIDHSVRLIDVDHYSIEGFDRFYGCIAGLLAGNYDITDVYVDSILKIVGRDYDHLGRFLEHLKALADEADTNFVFTVSADLEELPDSVKKFA